LQAGPGRARRARRPHPRARLDRQLKGGAPARASLETLIRSARASGHGCAAPHVRCAAARDASASVQALRWPALALALGPHLRLPLSLAWRAGARWHEARRAQPAMHGPACTAARGYRRVRAGGRRACRRRTTSGGRRRPQTASSSASSATCRGSGRPRCSGRRAAAAPVPPTLRWQGATCRGLRQPCSSGARAAAPPAVRCLHMPGAACHVSRVPSPCRRHAQCDEQRRLSSSRAGAGSSAPANTCAPWRQVGTPRTHRRFLNRRDGSYGPIPARRPLGMLGMPFNRTAVKARCRPRLPAARVSARNASAALAARVTMCGTRTGRSLDRVQPHARRMSTDTAMDSPGSASAEKPHSSIRLPDRSLSVA